MEGRQRGRYVAEAVARAERMPMSRVAEKQRHLLARVVRAVMGRVVAVVGRDDQQVFQCAIRQEAGKPTVEGRKRLRIAGRITTMAVFRVEIHQVGEDEACLSRMPSSA